MGRNPSAPNVQMYRFQPTPWGVLTNWYYRKQHDVWSLCFLPAGKDIANQQYWSPCTPMSYECIELWVEEGRLVEVRDGT